MFYYPLTGGEAIVFIIVCVFLFRWIYKEDKKAELYSGGFFFPGKKFSRGF